ncbi:MAG: penicillin acylase family protein [Planctomycetota bacterium]|nr:penicillin acylase family protein [Planctomycetota bacterium]
MRLLLCLPLLTACVADSAWRGVRQSLAGDAERARLEALAAEVTIHRDAYGVPHIEGPTDASVVFGLCYARAEDEFEVMEQSLFLTLGRNAEAAGEAGLVWDRVIHALDIPGLARQEYLRMPTEERALVDAAADGVNWYLATHPEVRPARLRHFEPWYFVAAEFAFQLHALGEATGDLAATEDGSNAWAIAGSRTTTGHAMLLANPHIPLGQVYEAHLHSDEGLHVSGMLAYGRGVLPVVGFNEHVAWTLTVNRPDTADVYAVRFDHPSDPDLYRHGAGWKRVRTRAVTVYVRLSEEALEEQTLTLRSTHHGPILHQDGALAYAVRVAGIERGDGVGQWYAMARARDLEEFQAAVGRLGLHFHNVVAADSGGRIWYVYNGAIPRRAAEFDWSLPVDGNDPATDWRGLHGLAQLPQVIDPECGYVQNCNSLPWTTSASAADPRAADFPPHLVGPDFDDPRVAMSHAVLGRSAPFTFEDWCGAAFDRTVHDPHGMLARLLSEASARTAEDPRLESALATLARWDRRLDLDAVAPTLFFLWLERVAGYSLTGEGLPIGVSTSNLLKVLDDLERRFRTWEVAWGELNRHQRPIDGAHSDQRGSWPCLGAHPWGGTTFCFLSRRPPGCNKRYGYHGNSYVAAVELRPEGPRARTILDFGQSRDPASPHFEDQAPLYASGEMKPAPFTRAAVRAAATTSYHPGEQP